MASLLTGLSESHYKNVKVLMLKGLHILNIAWCAKAFNACFILHKGTFNIVSISHTDIVSNIVLTA